MNGLVYFNGNIHLHATITDEAFLKFLADHPEESIQPCPVCNGCGWVGCKECAMLEIKRDDQCAQCNGYGALYCGACDNTGLAIWSWWTNATIAEHIARAYWNLLCAGVFNLPPLPGHIYKPQRALLGEVIPCKD